MKGQGGEGWPFKETARQKSESTQGVLMKVQQGGGVHGQTARGEEAGHKERGVQGTWVPDRKRKPCKKDITLSQHQEASAR